MKKYMNYPSKIGDVGEGSKNSPPPPIFVGKIESCNFMTFYIG